jgi:hypothetical protein
MVERLVSETPAEFFREQLLKAMEHQKVSTSAFTEYYLVNLLASCVRGDSFPAPEPGYDEMPLAILYAQALQASRQEQARLLKTLGDMALFVSGFFPDSLARRAVDLGYYRSMGGHAYACLSQQEDVAGLLADVFSDLAQRFMQFADVLSEVSEATHVGSNASLVKLYERWLQTGSARAALLLAQRGIVPARDEGRLQ